MSNLPFTLDQLKILQTILKEGSFKKAAKKLYISQPAVSLQIQNLERQLNSPIFYRNRKKVHLTKSGNVLNRYSERILQLCEETCQALEELRNAQSHTFIIGANQTTGTYLLPQLISILRHKHPYLTLDLYVHCTSKLSRDVVNETIDLAIVSGKIPDTLAQLLDVTAYAEDELALILPVNHPFSSLDRLRKEDLYRLRYIALKDKASSVQEVIEEALTKNGIDSRYFNYDMELNSIEAIKNAVQSGLGAAFVSVSAISKEIDLRMLHWAKIEDLTIKRTLYIVTNPKSSNKATVALLKEELLEMFYLSTERI